MFIRPIAPFFCIPFDDTPPPEIDEKKGVGSLAVSTLTKSFVYRCKRKLAEGETNRKKAREATAEFDFRPLPFRPYKIPFCENSMLGFETN